MQIKRQELYEQSISLQEIRKIAGLNRKEFANYTGIPLRTLEDWESGKREMSSYMLKFLSYYVKMERYLSDHHMDIDIQQLYREEQ